MLQFYCGATQTITAIGWFETLLQSILCVHQKPVFPERDFLDVWMSRRDNDPGKRLGTHPARVPFHDFSCLYHTAEFYTILGEMVLSTPYSSFGGG